jgi:hypothetical protein
MSVKRNVTVPDGACAATLKRYDQRLREPRSPDHFDAILLTRLRNSDARNPEGESQ